ncbi:MAG: 2-polyprenyl-6-methoxyphenol hydroxylase-like FAD-dependent oxidoreductase [Colwellia sp.]|jgi:2-polyprenyl-6-methoxyphenol hydroxylase-like FAD-dependent oxidoreductase
MTTDLIEHTQVAIIGGGPAGTCCALRLAQLGITDVTIIEAANYQNFRIGESIPPESKALFLKLGLWQGFLAQQHEPCYGSCSWWGDQRRGYNDSMLNPLGHGWHLNRPKFNAFLAEQTKKSGIKLLTNCQFDGNEQVTCSSMSAKKIAHGLKLTTKQAGKSKTKKLQADFVVDASGGKAVFATLQGQQKTSHNSLVSLACLFEIVDDDYPLSKQTHLEAIEHGWWYAARLPDNKVILSLNTDAKTVKQLALQQDNNWLALLQQSTNSAHLLSGLKMLDKRPKSYPAPSFILDKVVGSAWLAIGDAASSFDPITSGGIFKSISDGVIAAEVINDVFLADVDEQKAFFLSQYQDLVSQRYQQYLQVRQQHYRQEQRFPQSDFWQLMQGA